MPQAKEQGRANGIAAAVAAVLCGAAFLAMAWGLNWGALGTALGRYANALGGGWQWPGDSIVAVWNGSSALLVPTLCGLMLLRFLLIHRKRFSCREQYLLTPLVGTALLSCAVFGMSFFNGDIYFYILLLALSSGLVCGSYFIIKDLLRIKRGFKFPKFASMYNWAILLPFIFLFLPYAISPAVESDALRYHLGAPSQWWQSGNRYLPYQAFSNFPFLPETLYWLIMGKFGGGAKLLHFFMLLISLGLLSLITRNLGARSPWTGLAFLSIPAAAILACWAFTDMFLVAYFLAFVYVCIRSIKHPHRWGGAPIALMIGAGLGLKYTMLPLIGVLGFVWAALYWIAGNKLSPARRIRTILVAGLGGLLLGSPWYIRNWVNTGNPFYPLAYGIFGDGGGIHRRGEWSAANAEFYLSKAAEKGVHLGLEPGWLSRLIELFISPFTTTFRFQNFEQHIIGVIPLFAVIVLIVAFIAWLAQGRPGDRTQKLVWGFAASALVASWLLWFFTYQSNRLLLPTFALAIAMAAPVAAGWMRHGPRWISYAVHTLTGLGIALGLAILIMLMGSPERVEGWKTGIGLQRPEIYLAGRLNYYEAARWASKNLAARQPSHRILLVGEHRGMYWEIPTTHSDWFDTPQPLPWIRASIDNDAMLDAMLEQKISWIYLNGDELRLYHDDFFKPRFTPEEYTRFESLWRNPRLKPIWQNRTGTQLIFEIGMK